MRQLSLNLPSKHSVFQVMRDIFEELFFKTISHLWDYKVVPP